MEEKRGETRLLAGLGPGVFAITLVLVIVFLWWLVRA